MGLFKRKVLEGIVKEDFGTVPRIVRSSGALFGNESVKIGKPTYGLVLETDMGEEYTISVRNIHSKPVYALAKAIKPRDRIRINYDFYTKIGKDHIGKTDSDSIELIEKGKK